MDRSAEPQSPRRLERLDEMSAEERLAAFRQGVFSAHECAIWASRYPEEVPLVNGEYEWISLSSADLD